MNTFPRTTVVIKDAISDALGDESASAQEIANVIRDELKEWIEYHRLQMEKAEKILELLASAHDTNKFNDNFNLFGGISDHNWSPSYDSVFKPYVPNDSIKF